MSYTALYRKYRPDSFAEVKGQDHIVTTLRNQVIAGRISHAYLFCGTRGTGKTSVAKILAKAVNCEHPVDGSPCGVCKSCRAIQDGTSLNVIEIDAASNNGVDNIRLIRDEVSYSPTEGKYKVYIIDEVHMLSGGAFNALLKTLEEPPAYVIFILATTEAHKIPVTILSRCQRYDFHRITQEEIALRLKDLLDREQVEADAEALRYIARKADGGMRDALSLTDQCISFFLGERLTYEKVLSVLGAVDTEVLGKLFRSIAASDVAAVFKQLEDLIFHGRDIQQLTADLLEYLRDLLLLSTTKDAQQILDASPENMERMREEASMTSVEGLMRDIRILSELEGRMRFGINKRVMLEVALVKLCRPQMETDPESLAERIRALEKMIENGIVAAPAGTRREMPASGQVQEPSPEQARYSKAAPEAFQRIKKEWPSLIEPLRKEGHLFFLAMQNARLKFDASGEEEDVLFVIVSGVLDADSAAEREKILRIEENIADLIGMRIHVRVLENSKESEKGGKLRSVELIKKAEKAIDFPIETVSDQED